MNYEFLNTIFSYLFQKPKNRLRLLGEKETVFWFRLFLYHRGVYYIYIPNTLIKNPAATADPITPATLGPIACISRKLDGFAFCPST